MKGATCKFCGKSFQNRQAVRAHPKSCPAYKHLPKATVLTIGRKPETSALRGDQPSTRPTPPSGKGSFRRPDTETAGLTGGWTGGSDRRVDRGARRSQAGLHRVANASGLASTGIRTFSARSLELQHPRSLVQIGGPQPLAGEQVIRIPVRGHDLEAVFGDAHGFVSSSTLFSIKDPADSFEQPPV